MHDRVQAAVDQGRRAHHDSQPDRVEDALARDPYVERYEITVSALNGKVYLYGTVDSQFEKSQAEDVA